MAFEYSSSLSEKSIAYIKQSGIMWIRASAIKVPAANAIIIRIVA